MSPCLTLSIKRYGSRVKWSNPGKGVAPSPTPRCSSYRKGSLRVTLDYGRQLYFTLLRYGARPHELDTQWDSNSLARVCLSSLLTITPPEVRQYNRLVGLLVGWNLWHINRFGLFKSKSNIYIYIYIYVCMCVCVCVCVWFINE